MLSVAVVGVIIILLTVNRMNALLNTELGFDKDSVISIETAKSNFVLPDSLVFSSTLPGFEETKTIHVKSEYNREGIKIAHQLISGQYFDFFNYKKLIEDSDLFMNHADGALAYINKSAVELLGISSKDDVPGTILIDNKDHKMILCGVVEDFESISFFAKPQAKIFQLSSDHLGYAFYSKQEDQTWLKELKEDEAKLGFVAFQELLVKKHKIWEDLVYSAFLFINIFILLFCMGYIGIKYARKKDKELFSILGVGIHVITLVISKTYIYLLAILGLVVVPMAFLIQKFWLGLYVYRVNFGLIDLFIILSIALLTVYLIYCPKNNLEDQLKSKVIKYRSA